MRLVLPLLVLACTLVACGPSTGGASSASATASTAKAAPKPSSSSARPGLTELPADPPMKPPLMGTGEVGAGGPKIGGIPLEKATPEDVKRALEKQKCTVTDGPVTEGIGHALEATCDGHAFAITFVAAGAPAPDPAKLDAAQKGAAIARSGAASLAIQPKQPADAKLAEDLLGRITSPS